MTWATWLAVSKLWEFTVSAVFAYLNTSAKLDKAKNGTVIF